MTRLAYICDKEKIIIFWWPKCASTTVVHWFIESVLGETLPSKPRRWLKDNRYVKSYSQARKLVETLDYRTVYFTRNPTSRIVSSFLNKFYIRHGKPFVNFNDLEDFAQDLIKFHYYHQQKPDREVLRIIQKFFLKKEMHETFILKGQYRGISFNELLTCMKSYKEKCGRLNNHWDTQLPENDFIKADFVVKQENFDDDLREVCLAFNLPLCKSKHKNRTSYPDGYRNTDLMLNEITTVDLLKERFIVRPENLIDEDNQIFINNFYKNDIEFFQY